jgi:hypothetical protein
MFSIKKSRKIKNVIIYSTDHKSYDSTKHESKRYKTDKVIESEAECNAVNEIFEIDLRKKADKDDDKIVEFLLGSIVDLISNKIYNEKENNPSGSKNLYCCDSLI